MRFDLRICHKLADGSRSAITTAAAMTRARCSKTKQRLIEDAEP
jgi:hypothetical protein